LYFSWNSCWYTMPIDAIGQIAHFCKNRKIIILM
jgi:hypothetical protein